MQEIALPTQEQARSLTDRIKVAVEGTWLLIQEAYTSRAWASLGYDTWDAYVGAEFGTARLALPKEERTETIQSLRSAGMSVRAIASATGLSRGTVGDEVSQLSRNGQSPDVVLSMDGRERPAFRPTPAAPSDDGLLAGDDWQQPTSPDSQAADALPSKPKRRPLPEAFTEAGRDFTRAAERLAHLTEDDRFAKNRETVHQQVPELLGALDHTTQLVQAMNLPAAETSEEARRWWATSLRKISAVLSDVANSLEKEQ